jgi:lipopolysaccharide export system permease protein
VARLAGMTLIAAGLLIGVELVLGEFLGPPLQQVAREQKAFSKLSNVSFGTGSGAWVRDGDLIFNVAGQSGQRQFGGMQIFELSPQHQLLALGHARSATAGSSRKWLLTDYAESRFSGDTVSSTPPAERIIESNVTAGFLGLAVQDPDQLTIRALWGLIAYYRSNALDAREYVFAFWSRIARTVAVAFCALLAIPFALGPLRSTGAGTRMLLGLGLGIVFFLMQRLIESSTVVFALNPVLLAWLPAAVLAGVSLALLAKTR